MDEDLGENGTVRYSARARGAARGLLRVHSVTGRLYASPRLALAPGDAYDVTVSRYFAFLYVLGHNDNKLVLFKLKTVVILST